ncbi:hypothetical protein [Bradyrhizobium sp. USDA 10063]
MKLNADPDRLDLIDIHAHAAKSAGVKLAISTDAHAIGGLGNVRFGVDQARRAWLGAADVINAQPLSQLKKLLKR